MKIALDSNVLAYAEGVNGPVKQTAILQLLARLPPRSQSIGAQVLAELYRVLVGKAKLPAVEARKAVLKWRNSAPVLDTTDAVMLMAIEIATMHRFSIWDSIIISAAAGADCDMLLSEDMQDGFSWAGLVVVNPLGNPHHPLLASVLC
ncbi:MAG TPA: PIN domain-containing protein [Rhizomicrobium sp.]|jgi:predicted nucleic acid-binding protein